MTDCKVVYWPRHLWTSSTCASAAHVPSAVCQRLSQDALCVVSLELQQEVSGGLEVLLSTTNVRTVRHVVLFDAHVAARGEFETLHSPHLMQQIGERFSGSNKCETRAAAASSGTSATITWLVETVGYYSFYVPFTALLVVTTAGQRLVHDMHFPMWFPAGGGKSVADLSTFMAVLTQQAHNAASLPIRLRQLYRLRKERELSRREQLELLEVLNWICFMLFDMLLGHVALTYLDQMATTTFCTMNVCCVLGSFPSTMVGLLRGNVEWLMGAPAGFKLNKPLASILGNGILLWFNIWSYVFAEILPLVSGKGLGHTLLRASGRVGLTLQLVLMSDLLNLTTWHSRWIYLYFAKLNSLQFGLFSSLSKLFLGKKVNVLRHRVDSCEYDVGQLLLGTLLFTILVFLVTTNLVFFAFFAGVRGSILLVSLLLWLPVVVVSSLPLASLSYRAWDPHFFVVGMQLEENKDPSANYTIIEIGGICDRSPQREARHRQKLRQALASWDTNDRLVSQWTVFELVPVASSLMSQFTRFHAYRQAVRERYSLAVIVKACLFGNVEIARVPLRVLFGLHES